MKLTYTYAALWSEAMPRKRSFNFMEFFFLLQRDISVFLLKQLNGYREYTNRLSGNILHAASRKAFSYYKPDVHRQKGREEHLAAGSRGSETTISTKKRSLYLNEDGYVWEI